jgi:hypothetical protein
MVKREKTAVVGLTLRLREDLRRRLAKEAEKADRSLNQEVIDRLEESFRKNTAEGVLGETIHLLTEMRAEHQLERMQWETFRKFGNSEIQDMTWEEFQDRAKAKGGTKK